MQTEDNVRGMTWGEFEELTNMEPEQINVAEIMGILAQNMDIDLGVETVDALRIISYLFSERAISDDTLAEYYFFDAARTARYEEMYETGSIEDVPDFS